MRRSGPLAAVVLASVALIAAADQQTPVFRSGTSLVQVDAVVTGPDGGPVLDLSVDDFALYDDGDRMAIRSVRLLGAAAADLKGPFAPIRNRDDEPREGVVIRAPTTCWRTNRRIPTTANTIASRSTPRASG